MSCADFVGTLFLARDVAHSVHLNTRSFAKHSALNTFYDEIIELADGFAEAYQGRHGLILGVAGVDHLANIGAYCFLAFSLKKRHFSPMRSRSRLH